MPSTHKENVPLDPAAADSTATVHETAAAPPAVPQCPNGHPLTEEVSLCPVCGTFVGSAIDAPPKASALPAAPSQALPAQIGPYVLQGERPLGQGGMGTVYRVKDRLFHRSLALKILSPEAAAHPKMKDELRRRFLDEAHLMGQLQHPGIPPVYDLAEAADGRPYFTMKLVKGKDLAALLTERASPMAEVPRYLKIFEQVCQTLAYVHRQNIFHRDLKPANIMVGAFGEVQVMDWGVAKVLSDAPPPEPGPGRVSMIDVSQFEQADFGTQAGAVIGSPAYMPPEQAAGNVLDLDKRSDVFGLGALLCEMLTGEPPFTGRTSREILMHARQGAIEPALARLDACAADRELVQLAKACLAVRPHDRPADAAAVATAVSGYFAGVEEAKKKAELEQKAAEVRAEERVRQTQMERMEERKRRWLGAGLALVVLAALFAGFLGFSSWEAHIDQHLESAKALQSQAHGADLTTVEGRLEADRLWRLALERVRNAENDLQNNPLTWTQPMRFLRTIGTIRATASDAARDRAFLAQLDSARYRRATLADADLHHLHPGATLLFGNAVADGYAQAFQDYGLDLFKPEIEEVVRRIKQKPEKVQPRLVTALEDWLVFAPEADQGRRLVQVADALDPDPDKGAVRAAAAKGEPGKLKAYYRKLRAGKLPKWKIATIVQLAEGLHLAGEINAAAETLRLGALRQPDDYWVHDLLGLYLLSIDVAALAVSGSPAQKNGRATIALGWRPVSLRPGYWQYHVSLGNLYREIGEPEAAHASFQEAVLIDGRSAVARTALARSFLERSDLAKAGRQLQIALELDAEYAPAYEVLASVRIQQGAYDQAVALLQHAPPPLRSHPGLQLQLGLALLRQGDYGEGPPALEQAIKHYEEQVKEARQLPVALRRLKDRQRTASLALAYDELNAALHEQGELDKAENYGRRCVNSIAGRKPLLRLATVLCEQGKFPAARAIRQELGEPSKEEANRFKPLDDWLAGERRVNSADSATTPADGILFARIYRSQGRYATAARWLEARQPSLADPEDRFSVARIFLLAGLGQGKEPLPEAKRSAERGKALALFHALLDAQQEKLRKVSKEEWPDDPQERQFAVERMARLQNVRLLFARRLQFHRDLAGVRGTALAALPEIERGGWEQFWKRVDDVVAERGKLPR